jgi:hypothetical protein
MKAPVIMNAKGEPIKLNAYEAHKSRHIAKKILEEHGEMFPSLMNMGKGVQNSLGYEVAITTLTAISKKISEQKLYEIPVADYLPVVVGQGMWSSNITTYRSFDAAGTFEEGIINLAGQNSRLSSADAAVDALNIKISNWAKEIVWSLFELEEAAKSGNWDIVSAKEKSRKRNWDLGVQRVAFLGANGLNGSSGSCLGLLNQAGVAINTTVITKAISSMSTTELKAFCVAVIEAYRSNCNRTAWPSRFVIPESDYNGLASQASPDFPIKSTLQLLEEMFQVITQKKDFKILPLAYADAAYHSDVTALSGKQVYTLLNYEEESVRMDIPLQYTNTLANSINNFQFQNVGYGQFTGVLAYRPLEMLYFQF